MAVPRPSSPLSADRRKSPPPRGPQKQQRFKTMSPTRTSKRTASKVTMVSPPSSTPMGLQLVQVLGRRHGILIVLEEVVV